MTESRDRQRWEKFSESPEFSEMKRQIVAVVRAAQLALPEIGDTWGVTVHVDRDMVYRVNHADYALFDMGNPEMKFRDRILVLAVLLDDESRSRRKTTSMFRGLAKLPYGRDSGFPKLVPGSSVLGFPASSFDKVISRTEVVEGLRRHVAARPRKLFSPNRHNPFTTSLFE